MIVALIVLSVLYVVLSVAFVEDIIVARARRRRLGDTWVELTGDPSFKDVPADWIDRRVLDGYLYDLRLPTYTPPED